MKIEFFMPMIPPKATAQEHKIEVVRTKGKDGKVHHVPRFYDPPEVASAKEKLRAHLAKHRPEKPLEGALRLMVSWYFPADETHPDGSPMIARPDTDNLDKGLKDIMTELKFWRDDAQVFSEFINKYYADVPGIGIRVTDE